jgi:hypothetical protein
MFDDDLFDHLTPRGTIEYPLTNVHVPRTNEHCVVLLMKYCGRGSPFFNALTKSPPLSDKTAIQERIAKLLARHGIAGWKHVEPNGTPIAYTAQLGEELLLKLIHAKRADKVDDAAAYATDADRFGEPVLDAADLGKG